MGISRQAYYKRNRAFDERLRQNQQVVDLVLEKRRRQPRLATRKLHYLMSTEAGAQVFFGRDGLFSILREARELVPRKRAYQNYAYPSSVPPSSQPAQSGPGADRTQQARAGVGCRHNLPADTGKCGLVSLATDAYLRKIVGHHVHDSLHTESVVKAYQKAVSQRKSNLSHHSDRAAQHCSDLYQRMHAKHGIKCSMADGYDCYQNAMAERINGILKAEFLLHRPKDLVDAVKMVDEC